MATPKTTFAYKSTKVPSTDHNLEDVAWRLPNNCGLAPVSSQYINITVYSYRVIAVAALAALYLDFDSRIQHLALGILMPGGAFVGAGGFWVLGFPLVLVLFAISLFLWFASGNIVAPFLSWIGLALLAPALPIAKYRSSYSVFVIPATALALNLFLTRFVRQELAGVVKKRDKRNEYLPAAIQSIEKNALAIKTVDDNELGVEELGQLRYILERAFQEDDDWTGYSIIDQFQTSSLRYQINELIFTLCMASKLYTPSFRGYTKVAQKKVIRKYCQKKVLGYWKYEVLWGKLSTNYEPVLIDNIMLTGFYLLGLALYEGVTGDDSFSQPGSLTLQIDDNHHYKHSTETLRKALIDNFSKSPYCLYACEPNWIYTFCNMQGATALIANDTNKGTHDFKAMEGTFKEAFIEEFMSADGSVHPIRSHLTGFRIPGLAGACNDFSVACLAGSIYPDIGKRMYAIARTENIQLTADGGLNFVGLVGADFMDPGNYTGSKATLYAVALQAAKEQGDKQVSDAITKLMDTDESLDRKEKDGVIWYEKVSLLMKGQCLRGRMSMRNGWFRTVREPVSDAIKNGPFLDDANYPEVLVAKARCITGKDLELVLYNGKAAGKVRIGLKKLEPEGSYIIEQSRQQFTADSNGYAFIDVHLDGRTPLHIVPCSV